MNEREARWVRRGGIEADMRRREIEPIEEQRKRKRRKIPLEERKKEREREREREREKERERESRLIDLLSFVQLQVDVTTWNPWATCSFT
jgi:hypothetical protein